MDYAMVWNIIYNFILFALFFHDDVRNFFMDFFREQGWFTSICLFYAIFVPALIPMLFAIKDQKNGVNLPIGILTVILSFAFQLAPIWSQVIIFGNGWWLGHAGLKVLFILGANVFFMTSAKKFSSDFCELDETLQSVLTRIKRKTGCEFKKVFICSAAMGQNHVNNCAVIISSKTLLLGKKLRDVLDEEQLEVILLHEAGHMHYRILAMIGRMFEFALNFAMYGAIALMLIDVFNVRNLQANMFGWILFVNCAVFSLDIISTIITGQMRKFLENLADSFVLRYVSGSFLADVLEIVRDNLPVAGKLQCGISLLNTHPDINQRIKRLRERS